MLTTFSLFVYGTLREGRSAAHMLAGCERIGDATVAGSMYDIDGRHPAIMLYGEGKVHGEVWRCPAPLLAKLDQYEAVGDGAFRRVAVPVEVDGAVPVDVGGAVPVVVDGAVPVDVGGAVPVEVPLDVDGAVPPDVDGDPPLERDSPDGLPCWTYVAGPRLAHQIRPENRIAEGRWP